VGWAILHIAIYTISPRGPPDPPGPPGAPRTPLEGGPSPSWEEGLRGENRPLEGSGGSVFEKNPKKTAFNEGGIPKPLRQGQKTGFSTPWRGPPDPPPDPHFGGPRTPWRGVPDPPWGVPRPPWGVWRGPERVRAGGAPRTPEIGGRGGPRGAYFGGVPPTQNTKKDEKQGRWSKLKKRVFSRFFQSRPAIRISSRTEILTTGSLQLEVVNTSVGGPRGALAVVTGASGPGHPLVRRRYQLYLL